jgi:signal transduction histidine kinase/ActR/RegA family two-component response regulator
MRGDKARGTTVGIRHLSNGAVVVLLLVGLSASFAGFLGARDAGRDTNGQLLREDAAQGALLLGTEAVELTSPFQQLGQVVTPDITPATFDAAAEKVPSALASSITLLRQSANGNLTVVAAVGTDPRPLTAGSDALVAALARQKTTNILGAFVAHGHRSVQEVYGKGYVPAGFVIYATDELGTANAVTQLPGVFEQVDAAAYAGSIKPANLLIRTSGELPSGNQMGISVLLNPSQDSTSSMLTSHPSAIKYPGQIIVAMSSEANLSGGYAADFPRILLLVGILSTLITALLLLVVVRRRDEALGLVEDLRGTNVELDEALTRQAQAEQSLHQVQRMEAVGQLAGGIAHDFNNLLQVIISYSGFISEAIEPESEAQKDIVEVQKAAHRAAELTRQLLVFSRQDVSRPAVLDLNAVVMKAERLLRHALGEDVRLTCTRSPGPSYVLADAGELDQMLMNLSINARDAMPRGGELSIVVDSVQVRSGDEETDELAPGRYARIEIRDEGEGMTPEVVAKAFEPFFTTKETGRGTGLGLAMVFGIVTRLGGRVSISSAVGVGTTVSLLFPFSAESPTPDLDEPEGRQSVAGREVVLLVEDEDGVRRSTTRILQWRGYEVLAAENTVQALSIFHATKVDILVTDLIMPGGVSGNELAEWLREEQPDLPVVFMTGYSAEAISERGIIPVNTALIKKPFPPEELLDAVAHAIAEKASMVSP